MEESEITDYCPDIKSSICDDLNSASINGIHILNAIGFILGFFLLVLIFLGLYFFHGKLLLISRFKNRYFKIFHD